MVIYEPYKLKNSKEKIKQIHQLSKEVTFNPTDTNLKELICRLASLSANDLEREAYALSADDIRIVAAYLPGNCYNVDLENLFTIYTYRANSNIFEILYNSWQDNYKNNICNAFIYQWLMDDNGAFDKVVGAQFRTPYRKILLNGEVIPAFANYIKEGREKIDDSLEDILKPWKLKQSSKLYYELKYLFYTYCKKKDYFDISKEELLLLVKQYAYKKTTVFKKFLVNFVSELKLSELSEYSVLGKYMSSLTEVPGTPTFEEFFAGVSQPITTKYVNWINQITINEVFGNDERSVFWRDYAFRTVKKYARSNSLVMETEDYIITEFMGKATGPMYFYKKDVFYQKVVGWFKYKDNKELRIVLKDHKDLYLEREEHRKPYGNEYYWQGIARGILRQYNMTSKIIDE